MRAQWDKLAFAPPMHGTSDVTLETEPSMSSVLSATSSTNPILRASSDPILDASIASLLKPALPSLRYT